MYALINWSIALSWFLYLACLVTAKQFIGKIDKFRVYIDRTMGGTLMILGLKMLLV